MNPRLLTRAACAGLFLLTLTAATAGAANLLANPGFEAGTAGWITFGNVYAQSALPPQFVPNSGNGLVSMFGPFSGPWGVSGMFQEFPAAVGSQWAMSSNARHWSGDPMFGPGVPNGNWVVEKIVFKDAGDVEIGAAEATIMDGTYATDVWFPAATIVATAPAGTVKVQAFILFIQPGWDGGAALIDDVMLEDISAVPTVNTTWGAIKALY